MGNYYAVTYSNSLSHHGIKGQQWGRRRFQYEDGSLTPEGKKRYGIGDRIRSAKTNLHNKMRDSYSKQYQSQYKGMTKEEADAAAEKRLKTMKKVAIGAGIVVGTAAAVYVARNVGRNYFDETIKAGTTIQTLADDPNRLENGKAFYTAFRDADKMKYAGMFGTSQQGGLKNKIQAVAEKDIKVASSKTAKKVYEDLKKNDPEFRQLLKTQEKNLGLQKALDFGKKSEYEKFNTYDLLSPDENSMKVQKKFYDKLKEMGYQGVHDVNDRKYSGFNTKATIIFDNDNFKKNAAGSLDVNVTKLSQEEVQKGANFAAAAMLGDSVTHPKVVATGAAVVGMMAIDKTEREIAQEQQAKKTKRNKVAK